jgi:hypothetical protein
MSDISKPSEKEPVTRNPINFLKVIEGEKKNQEANLKEAFKQMRIIYLEMMEASFTAEDAMTYLAALTRHSLSTKE